ncbi:unnamed protein product (macronuclear) [Paramecium tetraurelia]|uniref:Protein kinase domain-containing protein n=1 Tax=Paramecium tetraurelia TaxID=5888 RepID=A0C714_PARTE|nr:uncharacterized protein GSPATT00035711001 [Paramecium tetraurelia]CAK66581.1 unnamed protein product [Paramecium tetraurelia]|eukprot:XP_001433978.1 hypothetical protein (macronuclear) [Paramecium tetraurelia strain d4-2]
MSTQNLNLHHQYSSKEGSNKFQIKNQLSSVFQYIQYQEEIGPVLKQQQSNRTIQETENRFISYSNTSIYSNQKYLESYDKNSKATVSTKMMIAYNECHFYKKYMVERIVKQSKQCKVVLCQEIGSNQKKVAKIYEGKMINFVKFIFTQQEDIVPEIQTNCKLSNFPHRNIISLIDLFIEHELIALVFEYQEGGTLYDFLVQKQFQLTDSEVKIIMKQILKGLRHLQKQEIIHRDIKLDNIMFTEFNNIKSLKIIDFGCAAFINDSKAKSIKCGTLGYIAPEILNDQYYDYSSDIYSVGSIFHILLSGTRIYPQFLEQKQLKDLNSQNAYKLNKSITCPLTLDLLKSMLSQQSTRPKANCCLKHEYFIKPDLSITNQQSSILLKTLKNAIPKIKKPFSKMTIFQNCIKLHLYYYYFLYQYAKQKS